MGRTGHRRRRLTATAVGIGLLLTACSTATTSGTTTTVGPQRVAASRMLTPQDLGSGWAPSGAAEVAALPCSTPRTSASLVGPGGSVVRLAQPGGMPSVVEFAAATASPQQTYVQAIDELQTSASCGATQAGHTTTSTFVEVLPLPRVGDRSVGMLFSNTAADAASQTGYEIVRTGRIVAVVGYTNPGTLDVAALGRVTTGALGKLDR